MEVSERWVFLRIFVPEQVIKGYVPEWAYRSLHQAFINKSSDPFGISLRDSTGESAQISLLTIKPSGIIGIQTRAAEAVSLFF